jgi:hypothetical protein
MRVPVAPQAIDTHMQQKRTLEQRETIDAKTAAPELPQTQTLPKKPVVKKLKKAKNQPAATTGAAR